MKSTRIILSLAVVIKLVLSVLICWYFWNATTLFEIKQLPLYVLIMAVVYIGFQMISRKLSAAHNWWDWVYYIGLLSIMIPVMLADETNQNIYHVVTDYGTFLLVLPVLVDGYYLINKPPKRN